MRASRWIIMACLAAVSAGSLLAERGVVYTKDGHAFQGEIIEESDVVTVQRGGVVTKVIREDIRTLVITGEPVEAIQSELGKLNKADVPGRLRLARKALSLREYDLARQIVSEVQDIEPNSRDAADLSDLIRYQANLDAKARAATRPVKGARTVGGALDHSLAIPLKLVDEEDMNAIRQAELQPDDASFVRVRFLNDVRRRFAAMPQRDPQTFAQLTAFQQALTIIREGTPEMRKDVQIIGDPLAIRGFRGAQKQILASCAATQCHGSLAGGNFVLFALPESDPVTYTNYLLIQRYSRINPEKTQGIFGGGGTRMRMIDRDYPQKSLLLQYGLPLDVAGVPHPKVPAFAPAYRAVDDGMYSRVSNWIRNDLPRQDPTYEIKYVSPVQAMIAPTTAPSE